MKLNLPRFALSCFAMLAGLASANAQVGPGTPEVTYNPGLTRVEGDQPLTRTVYVAITSPSNVPVGSSTSITPVFSMLSQPAGIPDAVALSYVSFNPSTLTFTGPGQTILARVDLAFPDGVPGGLYAYKFLTPGWPVGTQDLGGFLNATIYPAPPPPGPPTVEITSPVANAQFTYNPAVGLQVPITFLANAPVVSPLRTVVGDVNGISITPLQQVTNADGSVTATGSVNITAPGTYTITARATNDEGTATDVSDFTVVLSVPPPTVAIASPVNGSTYTLPASGPLSVPYSFSGHSFYGGMRTLTATLNGQPVTFTPAGIGTLDATGTGNFSITTAGSYELVVTGTDDYGSATARTTFTVTSATNAPRPCIKINSPDNCAVYTRVAGSGPTLIPFSYTGVAGTGFTISSLTGTLNGSPVTATVTGIGTQTATGTGTFSITTAGTYTLSATAKSGNSVASTSVTFRVKEVQPPQVTCSVNWIAPTSGCTSYKGGASVGIKFEVNCRECRSRDDDDCHWGYRSRDDDDCHRDYNSCDRNYYGCDRNYSGCDRDGYSSSYTAVDRTVVVSVSEIYSNGSAGAPRLYAYGDTATSSTYTIKNGNDYTLNFATASGKHRYRIEVYRPKSGGGTELLGQREFTTK